MRNVPLRWSVVSSKLPFSSEIAELEVPTTETIAPCRGVLSVLTILDLMTPPFCAKAGMADIISKIIRKLYILLITLNFRN